jgi:hypothetical protein
VLHTRPSRAFALLRLRQAVSELQSFTDNFFQEYIIANRRLGDAILTSHQFILSINTMLFAVVCMSAELVRFGHKIRDLVELEHSAT